MDLRTEKTKRSIINSFLELRSRKPLEKITVKELSEKAEINKATFYLHYHDIYDLSGWGPDYGDPQTYLDTMLPDYAGYMTKCMGIF